MKPYDHTNIEKKWQNAWEKQKIYQAKNFSKNPKFYSLIEFPFPSGDGMHVGHLRSNTAMDIVSRKRRMEGYNVLYPIGWDAFGLPTENYAIKTKQQPKVVTKKNTDNFRKQLKSAGFSFDWSREINTTDPGYYKWTQWIFLQLYKHGLAYKKKMEVNWCPKDKIVLANEEVVTRSTSSGQVACCERCGTPVEKREKEQWMLAITKYADRLDKDLDTVDYVEQIKIQQRNWIGKSEGAEIDFKIVREAEHLSLALPKGKGEERQFGYHTTDQKTWRALQDRVLEMRKNSTPAEEILWKSLKGDKAGYHFRRQHIIGNFVVDFVCLEKSLVVEVDGDIHDYQQKEDSERTLYLEQNEFRVIRFRNSEVEKNTQKVIEDISSVLKALPFGEGLGEVDPSSLITVFTTRPDTLFGATYLVIAPEHELVQKLKSSIENWSGVQKYIDQVKKKTEIERTSAEKEKTGVELRGVKAINPATNEEIPIFVADYVLAHYGTGAIMAVPAHDERDWQFAKKYKLPIRCAVIIKNTTSVSAEEIQFLVKNNFDAWINTRGPFTDGGILVNSNKFDGLDSMEAKKKITEAVGGRMVTTYKLRDWIFSRQRYWGEPIPMIHCEKCGWVPVPEKDLPVTLPEVKNYEPTDTGESPLASISTWVNVKCPTCKGPAKRETDTMPNWAGSSWYFLRYADPENKRALADPKKLKYWQPVDWYNGGMEHTTLHLLYSRFWNKFLFDIGVVPTSEPYQKRTSHGLILAPDGEKMSKSRGNVVNPDEIIEAQGADTLRLYEMFMGPFDQAVAWSTDGIVGPRRFLERVWRLFMRAEEKLHSASPTCYGLEPLINKTIKKVSADIEAMAFNTAISAMMILVNEMEKQEGISKEHYELLLKILAPFAPHITEELWHELGHKKSIHLEPWPQADESKIVEATVIIVVQINGKVRAEFEADPAITEQEAKNTALSMAEVRKWLEGKEIKKVIFVKGKVLNFVVV